MPSGSGDLRILLKPWLLTFTVPSIYLVSLSSEKVRNAELWFSFEHVGEGLGSGAESQSRIAKGLV